MPNYRYLDPDIEGYAAPDQFKAAKISSESDSYRPGDIIEIWDNVFRWDEHCVPLSKAREWQKRGDGLADAALPIIQGPAGKSGGTDLYARLEAAATAEDAQPEVKALWQQLHLPGPYWPSKEQIKRGADVFHRYATQFLAALLHYSLSAGFAQPDVAVALNMASYLVPPMNSTPEGEAPQITKASNDRTYKRLMETTQFVVECMGDDGLDVGGKGWKAAIRVRLLHTTMRARLRAMIKRQIDTTGKSHWDENLGIPISQMSMFVTLGAFCPIPPLSAGIVGIMPLPQECEDYTAIWRAIGWLIGIDEDILSNHFSTYHQATRLLGSALLVTFPSESDPPAPCQFPFDDTPVPKQNRITQIQHESVKSNVYQTPATLPVLLCVCDRWPSPFNFAQHCAASRRLMGDQLADWLSVPRSTWRENLEMRIGWTFWNYPIWFGRHWRRGWDVSWVDANRKSVENAVALVLDDRRTKFRPRKQQSDWEPDREADEFEADRGADERVLLGTSLAKWVSLYAEMLVVSAVPVVVLSVSSVMIYRGKLNRDVVKGWATHSIDFVKSFRQ